MSGTAPRQGAVAKRQAHGFTPNVGSLLQRKCACGSSTSPLISDCDECKSAKRLQAKFIIGTSDDPMEIQADQVADQVSTAFGSIPVDPEPPRLSRFAALPSRRLDAVPASVSRVLGSTCRPLEPALRHDMERCFGHDLSRVRVHTSATAEQSARDVHARAYTVGHDIVFGAHEFQPGTREGRHLIAHELTHVLQQSTLGASSAGQRNASIMPAPIAPVSSIAQHADGPHLQRSSWAGAKEEAYGVIIAGVRKARDGMQNRLKRLASNHLPASLVPISDGIIETIVGSVDVLASIMMAVLGIVVGFGEGVVGMIQGLAQLSYGAIKLLYHLISGIFTNFDAAEQDLNALWDAVKSLPAALKTTATDWLDRFGKASTERQTLMIGELTGEVMFIIATYALAAGRAGSATKAAATAADAGAATGGASVVGATFEAATTAGRTQPVLTVFEGGGGRAGSLTRGGSGPGAANISGSSALKVGPTAEPVAPPLQLLPPLPAEGPSLVAPATAPSAATLPSAGRDAIVLTAVAAGTAARESKKQRPPFVLHLPLQKASHLATYRSWLGVLQSDPKYERDEPAQLSKWHKALRIGGSDGIPHSVYERGHSLGLTGTQGERQIRVPDWSRAKKTISMEVDHIIELQLTPALWRTEFNSMFNYELLDAKSNSDSGNLIKNNVREERAKQVAFDPLRKDAVLPFDKVEIEGGSAGERWSSEDLRTGEQLDAYEQHNHD